MASPGEAAASAPGPRGLKGVKGWGNAALEASRLEGALSHEEGKVMAGASPGRRCLLSPSEQGPPCPGLSAVPGPLAPEPDLAFGPDSVTYTTAASGWLVNYPEPPLPYL